MASTKSRTISVRLPHEIADTLTDLARDEGLSVGTYVARVLANHVDSPSSIDVTQPVDQREAAIEEIRKLVRPKELPPAEGGLRQGEWRCPIHGKSDTDRTGMLCCPEPGCLSRPMMA